MGIIKTKGIVIAENNMGDFDKMVTLLTPNGKIGCSAKGSRRPKSQLMAGTQFLCFGEYMMFKGTNTYTLNSCDTIEVFYNIRTDLDKLEYILYIYYYMCSMYDKECSILGFSLLTGIHKDTFMDWGASERKLSTKGFELVQKLRDFREESLSNKLATGNKNPVGILAILNRHFAWNLPGVSRENAAKTIKTAADLPQLGKSGNAQGSNVRQIAQQEIIVQDVQEIPQSQ